MEMKTAYPATLQDIIFEGRNKAYGAYMLRKIYPRHIWQAFLLATASFLLLITLPGMVSKLFPEDVVTTPMNDPYKHVLKDPPIFPAIVDPIIEPVEPVAPSGGQKSVATVKNTTPKVVDDKKTVVDEPPTKDMLANAASGAATSDGEKLSDNSNPIVGDGNAKGTGAGDGKVATIVEPFISVQEMPEFEGGLPKLMAYLSKNIRYPESAKRNEVEGTVVMSFVIEPTGEVSNITVLKGLGYGTEEEAIRVLKKMPRWKPGIQNGKAVPVRMTLPIRLELKK